MSLSKLDRRRFLQICGGAATAALVPTLVPTLGCGGKGTAGGDSVDGGTTADLGDFVVPPLDEGTVVDGVRVFELDLQQGQVEWVAGAPTATYGVNGAFLGPTLRFRRGERVRLEVTNGLAEPTTLHWHGMQVPARADGGPYQPIAAGTTWVSEYDVVQRAMTAWYHPHLMHMTARHVYMGIAGMIVVEDAAQDVALPSTYGHDDLPVVIQDRRLFADGKHPYSAGNSPTMHDMMAGMRGQTLLVNGVQQPRRVVPRGLVRLRLLNGSNARIYNLGFSDNRTFLHIASDGGLLAAPITATRLVLAPGERAEILVDLGADPVGAQVKLQSYSAEIFASLFTGMMGSVLSDSLDRSTFDIMTLEAGIDTTSTAPPTSFAPIDRIAEAAAVSTRTLALAMVAGTVTINGTRMTELGNVPAAINFQIPAGDIEIWTLTNSSGMAHPIHLHNHHFQVLDIDGAAPPPALAGWKDTVLVPPGRTVRLAATFAGSADAQYPYLFHCHILEHEDMGMMGQFFIV